jgi:hypothetical protein
MKASAGGHEEHPWLVNNSTTTGRLPSPAKACGIASEAVAAVDTASNWRLDMRFSVLMTKRICLKR